METFVFTNRVGHSTCFDSYWQKVTGQPVSIAWSQWPEVIHRRDQARVLEQWLLAIATRADLDLTCELAVGGRVRAVAGPLFENGEYAGHAGRVIQLEEKIPEVLSLRHRQEERRFFNQDGETLTSYLRIDGKNFPTPRPHLPTAAGKRDGEDTLIGTAESGLREGFPVYLVPTEQVLLVRTFSKQQDARTWADTFNRQRPYGYGLVAIEDPASYLKRLGVRNLRTRSSDRNCHFPLWPEENGL